MSGRAGPRRRGRLATLLTVLLAVLPAAFGSVPAAPAATGVPAVPTPGLLVYAQSTDRGVHYALRAARPNGSGARLLTGRDVLGRATVSRDGRTAWFSSPVTDGSDGRFAVWRVPTAGGSAQRVTSPTYGDFDPAVSPDNATIAFVRNPGQVGTFGLWLAGATGAAPHAVPGAGSARFPAWSPNGSALAYVAADGLHVVAPDGSGNHLIVTGAVRDPAWSPDGARIAFVQVLTPTTSRVAVVGAGGGAVSVVDAPSTAQVDSPTWASPSQLYAVNYRGGGDDGRTISTVVTVVLGGAPVSVWTPAPPLHGIAFVGITRSTTPGVVTPAADGTLAWALSDVVPPQAAWAPTYGIRGDIPVAGDWDGDGRFGIGAVRRGPGDHYTWYLRNSLTTAGTWVITQYGQPSLGDVPVTGDWDGDGRWSIGVARPTDGRYVWWLSNSVSPAGTAYKVTYGESSKHDRPVTGDWGGTGATAIGVARPDLLSGKLQWWFSVAADVGATRFSPPPEWGSDLATPVGGDWRRTGAAAPGVVQSIGTSLQWTLATSAAAPADWQSFGFGAAGAGSRPVVGDWDGV